MAGQPDTVASFAWTVARDALVNASEVNNGVTMTSVGQACGGPNGAWRYTVTMQGQSVSAEYDLHWTFGPGSRSAPVEGTGHMDSSGVQGTVTIEHGHMTFTASGNGFDGVAESDISANLVGPRAHPRLKFIQTGGTGTITGIAGSLFSFGGGAFGEVDAGLLVADQAIARWRQDGFEPLRIMGALLEMPYTTESVEGRTVYVWPGIIDWAPDQLERIDESEWKSALESIYPDIDAALRSWIDYGGYIGWRIGIADDGRWMFFIAGD